MRPTREEREVLQFAENFRAWTEAVGAPAYTPLPHVCRPLRPDRILFFDSEEWRNFMVNGPFLPWNTAIHEHRPLGRATAVKGFREDAPFAALQTVVHLDPDYGLYVEADFDIGNPAEGLVPLLTHVGEWLWYRLPNLVGGRTKLTSPFLIRRLLRRRGIPVRKA